MNRVVFAAVAAVAACAQSPLLVDYPADGSIFPPEITAPAFLWRGGADTAAWLIEIEFADGAPAIRVRSKGGPLPAGEIDPRAIAETNEPPRAPAGRSWRPDPDTWAAIKRHSVERAAIIRISGGGSSGQIAIRTSSDPVGAPIFYRDVPLMPTETEKGVIKPIVPSALPLIAWRLRNIGEPGSRVVMRDLPTCANCHSFSRDGKTLAMDLDGPQNDKSMYAIAPLAPRMSIRNQDVIVWNAFPGMAPGRRTIAFMPQLSPDGRYAVATLNEDVYVANFKDYRFLQVFYPTRGILACYSRATGQIRALPGADDPRYVQANGVWSPDGSYLVFTRAPAADAYPQGRKPAGYAGDPNETPIRYDLCRIPFNGGAGGRAEPIAGASRNGKSNSFPRISPDGRWIVFVQSRNGQLMRPDGQLYIVPATGGRARRMRCNTPLMNSWHSFSPNGRWMVFSSKGRSPYTQMYLTHLDEQGNDSPAILVDNATAANRAVNLPEFVNIPPDGLVKIDVPAAEFYRLFDRAWELGEKGEYDAALAEWAKALALSPEDAKAHNNAGVLEMRRGALEKAVAHFRKAIEAKPAYAEARNNLGAALVQQARFPEAIREFQEALKLNPDAVELHDNLGRALAGTGDLEAAIRHWRRALELNPYSAEVHNDLGTGLFRKGRLEEAIAQFRKAVELNAGFAQARYNLGRALAQNGKPEDAAAQWKTVLKMMPGFAQARFSLAEVLDSLGRTAEAIEQWREGLAVDPDRLPALDRVARILATAPEASLRNGAEAVRLAERAVALSGGRDAALLDTLAAAYAEAGRFAEAVATVRKALALTGEAERLHALALYEARKPWRERRRP